MDAHEPILRPEHANGVIFAFALTALASGAGCFLYPSPADSWSDAYGRSPLDASRPSSDATAATDAGSGICAGAASCLDCCDNAYGLDVGGTYFASVWGCACSTGLCTKQSECGSDCANSPVGTAGTPCLVCLAAKAAKARCPSGPKDQSCRPESSCRTYADCIAGCEP